MDLKQQQELRGKVFIFRKVRKTKYRISKQQKTSHRRPSVIRKIVAMF